LKKPIYLIADQTYLISDYKLVNYYLAIGSDKAAVIDTGMGYGPIIDDIKSLTDKPLVVLITHGHPDHCGGAYAFDEIFMHGADETFAKETYTNEFRSYYADSRVPERFPGKGNAEAIKATIPASTPPFTYTPLIDGQVFDLGDRKLETIHTPGHSDGSVCFLDRKNRLLFSGDTVNRSIIIFGEHEVNYQAIKTYQDSLQRLWEYEADFDYLVVGHDEPLLDKTMIQKYLAITKELLEHGAEGAYEERGIRKGWVYRYDSAELWYRCLS
jgi:glyoxylase-like metal-dependent hydrolase (beta-lactamase superfamily II)